VRTFLVSEGMSPALRGRVERSVSKRASAEHRARMTGMKAPFGGGGGQKIARSAWLVTLGLAAVVAALAFSSHRAERRAVADEKASLAQALADKRVELPEGAAGFIARTSTWIQDAAAEPAPPDAIAVAIAGKAALDAWLTRPAAYVRMSLAEARDARSLEEGARASTKDAFLLCLLRPPPSGSTKDMLARVRGVYFDGAKVDDETKNVRRLGPAHVGLAAIGASFESTLRAADDLGTLRRLRRDLEGAPVSDAARAARAELLLVVIDEPGSPGATRVLFADLTSPGALVRLRRPLPPADTAPQAALYRDQLASCSLALDVRKAAEDAAP
jgi:hypothetical protein